MTKKWALMIGGEVHDTSTTDPALIHAPGLAWVPCGPEVAARWTWDGSVFTPPVPPPVPVPPVVTPLQARRALRSAGLIDAVEQWLATQPPAVRESWEYAVAVPRQDPIIAAAAAALGLSAVQLDELFRQAATL